MINGTRRRNINWQMEMCTMERCSMCCHVVTCVSVCLSSGTQRCERYRAHVGSSLKPNRKTRHIQAQKEQKATCIFFPLLPHLDVGKLLLPSRIVTWQLPADVQCQHVGNERHGRQHHVQQRVEILSVALLNHLVTVGVVFEAGVRWGLRVGLRSGGDLFSLWQI